MKVFINHIFFENLGGDGVNQDENVELTMNDCIGHNVYRGTFTITGGGGRSRITEITTDALHTDHKGSDLEMDAGEYGYEKYQYPTTGVAYRTWIDNCNFAFGFHMNFEYSKLLVTNTNVPEETFPGLDPYGVIVLWGPGGNLICRNSQFAYSNIYSNDVNNINSSMCANFIDCTFNLFKTTGCSNGFKIHDGIKNSNFDCKLGFDHCSFKRHNFIDFGANADISYAIIFQHETNLLFNDVTFYHYQNILNNNNGPETIKPYQYNINTNCAEFTNTYPQPGGTILNEQLHCGESEDDMKEHFGIKKFYLLQWDDISWKNKSCSNNNDGEIHVTAIGVPGITVNYELNGGSPNTTGIFTGLAAGTYTITATDNSVVTSPFTISTIFTLVTPTANQCGCQNGIDLIANTQNLILKDQAFASDLVNQYGSVISNKKFYFDGLFTIDDNITFDNCVLYFTTTGSVLLQNNATFDVSNNTLLASCDWWEGIQANDASQKVKIENNSYYLQY